LRIDLLHKNIRKYGTITNTLAAACELTGELTARVGGEMAAQPVPPPWSG